MSHISIKIDKSQESDIGFVCKIYCVSYEIIDKRKETLFHMCERSILKFVDISLGYSCCKLFK